MNEPDDMPLHPSVAYGLKSNTHVWAVTTIREIDADFLNHFDAVAAGEAAPDSEYPPAVTLLGQVIDCVLCEAPYDPLARRRKCPGRRLHPGIRRS